MNAKKVVTIVLLTNVVTFAIVLSLLFITTTINASPPAAPLAANGGAAGYVMVPPVAFQSATADTTATYRGYDLTPAQAATAQTYYAPIHLPNNAAIVDVTYYFTDTTAMAETKVTLIKAPIAAAEAVTTIAEAASGQTESPGYSSTTVTLTATEIIDNAAYAYYLKLDFDPTDIGKLYTRAVRVGYSYNVMLPVILKDYS